MDLWNLKPLAKSGSISTNGFVLEDEHLIIEVGLRVMAANDDVNFSATQTTHNLSDPKTLPSFLRMWPKSLNNLSQSYCQSSLKANKAISGRYRRQKLRYVLTSSQSSCSSSFLLVHTPRDEEDHLVTTSSP